MIPEVKVTVNLSHNNLFLKVEDKGKRDDQPERRKLCLTTMYVGKDSDNVLEN